MLHQYVQLGHGIALLILGLGLLATLHVAYGGRRGAAEDWLLLCLRVAGWALVLWSALALLVAYGIGPTWILVPVLITVAMATVAKFRHSERRALVWTLSFAAERSIPLSHAARGFAAERSDELGARVFYLADLLDGGMPLDVALRQAKIPVSLDVVVAARLGATLNAVPDTLRATLANQAETEDALRKVFERLLFLWLALSVFGGITAFTMIKIVPTFERMFLEFAIDLPRSTRWVIAVSQVAAYATPLVALPLLAVHGILLLLWLNYVGWLPWNTPGLGGLRASVDRTVVLRQLAVAVHHARPLVDALDKLETVFPTWAMRNRLARAHALVVQGTPWPAALKRAGLVTAYEAEVLGSAERVGNLRWALETMADTAMLRLQRRLRVLATVLTAVGYVGFSLCVLFYAVGMFSPLVEMILNLA